MSLPESKCPRRESNSHGVAPRWILSSAYPLRIQPQQTTTGNNRNDFVSIRQQYSRDRPCLDA
jgi:hypothetical protein